MPNWLDTPSVLLLGQAPGFASLLLPIVAIGFLFFFLIVRPEKKKQAAVASMQSDLKKNDRVVTAGGVFGVVVNVQQGSNEITLRVDENNNTRIHILRSSVSRVVSDEKSAGEEKDK